MKTQCSRCKKWSDDYPLYHFKLELIAHIGNKVVDEQLLFSPWASRYCPYCVHVVGELYRSALEKEYERQKVKEC
jgi:hypothetical protein